MEEESFSNPEIAKILNQYFVSIKVDREERPDIDNIYMNAVIAMTGNGGWPLTVFLTEDKKPFYGGTYFPPEDRRGMLGLKKILLSIANTWKNHKDEIIKSSKLLTQAIKNQFENIEKQTFLLDLETLKKAYNQLLQSFDSHYGGFGEAPKFPSAHILSFLLRYWKRTGEQKALEMVEKTLSEMSKGGIYDHLAGGFHRYSTDIYWRVPHFEKMIYDQAILSRAYLEAYQATGKKEYAKIAREIFEYVLGDMTSPLGGFFTAEDACSPSPENPNKKKEGSFYLWSKEELTKILSKEEEEIFSYYFGIESYGNIQKNNFEEFKGKNILYVSHTLEETAKKFKKSLEDIKKILKSAKIKLFNFRAKRLKPYLDDKILMNWNGLMISSLAFGSRLLDEPRYSQAAEKAAKFILKKLKRKDLKLLHRFRDGDAAILGNIEDYAFFIDGFIELYEATFEPDYLSEAKKLLLEMIKLFWDEEGGGFFFIGKDSEKLLFNPKEIYDGAIPSGNSISLINLIRLGKFTMDKFFEEKAWALIKSFSEMISKNPSVSTQMLSAVDFLLDTTKEIVIASDTNAKDLNKILKIIYRSFIPNKIVVFHPQNNEKAKHITEIIPFIKKWCQWMENQHFMFAKIIPASSLPQSLR